MRGDEGNYFTVTATATGFKKPRTDKTVVLLTSAGAPRHNTAYLHASIQFLMRIFGNNPQTNKRNTRVWSTALLWAFNEYSVPLDQLAAKGEELLAQYIEKNKSQLNNVDCFTEKDLPEEPKLHQQFISDFESPQSAEAKNLRKGIIDKAIEFTIKRLQEDFPRLSNIFDKLKNALEENLLGLKIVGQVNLKYASSELVLFPYCKIQFDLPQDFESVNNLALRVERSLNFLLREAFYERYLMDNDYLFYAGTEGPALAAARLYHATALNREHNTTRYNANSFQFVSIRHQEHPCKNRENADPLALILESELVKVVPPKSSKKEALRLNELRSLEPSQPNDSLPNGSPPGSSASSEDSPHAPHMNSASPPGLFSDAHSPTKLGSPKSDDERDKKLPKVSAAEFSPAQKEEGYVVEFLGGNGRARLILRGKNPPPADYVASLAKMLENDETPKSASFAK